MGTASKVICVLLRITELCSSVIVVALLSHFFYLLHRAPDTSDNSRLVYAEVISCLTLVASILLILPFKYSFYAWPLDAIFFICTIVAFALLANLNSSCTSSWYWNYWGFYWGRFWTVPRVNVTANTIGREGCSSWRVILAFLFIGSMAWMFSAILGLVVFLTSRRDRRAERTSSTLTNDRANEEKRLRNNRQTSDAEAQQHS